MNDVEPIPPYQESEEDRAVAIACVIGNLLLIIAILSVGTIGMFLGSSSQDPRLVEVFFTLFSGLLSIEIGIAILLLNCAFLFSVTRQNRFIGPFLCFLLVAGQLAVAVRGEMFVILGWLAYVVAFSITGWLLQRICGAHLSLHGANVFQRPLSIRVLALIPLLLLLMGFIPAASLFFSDTPIAGQPQFAQLLIYAALYLLVICLVPLLVLYGWLAILKWNVYSIIPVSLIGAILILLSGIIQQKFQSAFWTLLFFVGQIAAILVGMGLAYLPFHRFGFRLVWAKRALLQTLEKNVSFDEIT